MLGETRAPYLGAFAAASGRYRALPRGLRPLARAPHGGSRPYRVTVSRAQGHDVTPNGNLRVRATQTRKPSKRSEVIGAIEIGYLGLSWVRSL